MPVGPMFSCIRSWKFLATYSKPLTPKTLSDWNALHSESGISPKCCFLLSRILKPAACPALLLQWNPQLQASHWSEQSLDMKLKDVDKSWRTETFTDFSVYNWGSPTENNPSHTGKRECKTEIKHPNTWKVVHVVVWWHSCFRIWIICCHF